jgi:hypothetical protein
MQGISWVAEDLLVSEEAVSFKELSGQMPDNM